MEKEEVIKGKTYELKLNNSSYLLLIKQMENDSIYFQLRPTSNFSYTLFCKEFNFEELLKQLLLSKDNYNEISKILKYFDNEISKNNITLISEEKSMKLSISKEKECCLVLNETKLSSEEMLKMLYKDIIDIKLKNINDEKTLMKKNEELEKKINKVLEENNNIIKEKEEMKKQLNSFSEENSKLKTTLDNLHERFKDFKYNRKNPAKPENLRFIDYLTNNNLKSGFFALFTGLTDNIEYLVYNNKHNFNLDLMTLKDKAIVRSLKGHNIKVHVIRYFSKEKKEEYLLSCDENKICIIWDIQNEYNKKYTIKEKYFGNIFDGLLVFNILHKDCLILSSGNANEYTKLYELDEEGKFKFIKNIFGTNKNNTNYLIPWEYNNKHYIIELCDKKITINNLLDDEIYANLHMDPEGYHFSGYLYNDNKYLCVGDGRNNFVRIWDLINKTIYKQINFDASNAYEIAKWKRNYVIVACKSCFVVVDIEEGKMTKKVMLDNTNHYLCGLKKIKMIQLGECLISSDDSNNIRLFSI